ncbi:hypothetical protein [Polycyclovorans algicola]|uniref:hypothetical protein n=1 Tax=Polycyclovorans algicola TaxID=616992 RepID=UPI0012695BEB|nr:hypothetical protein [Polycyclovorans algicola]
MKLKSMLLPAIAAVFLLGCEANGVDADGFPGGGGGGNVPPGSVADTTNCATPVSGLCVLGGDSHPGGLVDVLLAPDGPLGPIAGAIDTDALVEALTFTLENDDGDLAGIVEGLVADGQLEEGLTLLLLGENGDGMGALAETLTNLLLPNDEGQGLMGLVSEDGGVGLVQALLIDGSDASCQAPLGTLCLISGDGNQTGLVDLLLTSGGVAGAASPTLTDEATDQLVATLGDLLESNGALADLVEGLFQQGQLAEGLEVLLMGSPDDGIPSGLIAALDGITGDLGTVLGEVGDFLGDVLLPGGGLGGLIPTT